MKLTKANLIKLTTAKLAEQGYCFCKDSLTGADGLFVKSLDEEMFLSLGLVISKFYESRFTGSFYLSETTRWASVWGDIPHDSYRRVGQFLLPEERRVLLDAGHSKEDVVDAWWNVESARGLENFLETVNVAEPRFVDQPALIKKIKGSIDVKEMCEHAARVKEIVATERVGEGESYPLKRNDC